MWKRYLPPVVWAYCVLALMPQKAFPTDVCSAQQDDPHFIRVTPVQNNRVKFELCLKAKDKDNCSRLGRDESYSIGLLKKVIAENSRINSVEAAAVLSPPVSYLLQGMTTILASVLPTAPGLFGYDHSDRLKDLLDKGTNQSRTTYHMTYLTSSGAKRICTLLDYKDTVATNLFKKGEPFHLSPKIDDFSHFIRYALHKISDATDNKALETRDHVETAAAVGEGSSRGILINPLLKK